MLTLVNVSATTAIHQLIAPVTSTNIQSQFENVVHSKFQPLNSLSSFSSVTTNRVDAGMLAGVCHTLVHVVTCHAVSPITVATSHFKTTWQIPTTAATMVEAIALVNIDARATAA